MITGSTPQGNALDAGKPGRAVCAGKDRMARYFSGNAGRYDRVSPVQQRMGRRLLEGVRKRPCGKRVRRILELGCGSGALTRRVQECFPGAEITALDLSPGMIDEARRNLSGVDFVCGDAEDHAHRAQGPYDLVLSNAAAQWFHDPAVALKSYGSLLSPGGLLAVSTFGDGTFRELKQSFEAAYRECRMPPREHVLPMRPQAFWGSIFPEAECSGEYYTLTYPDVRAFLKAVKRAGASYSGGPARPLSRAVFDRMSALYQERFPSDDGNGIRVTYHAIFLQYVPGPTWIRVGSV